VTITFQAYMHVLVEPDSMTWLYNGVTGTEMMHGSTVIIEWILI
jgi:hypothetical protein